MLASHLHLPTAAWGGHMGHFLLSVLILTSSTPLGNNSACSTSDTEIAHLRALRTVRRRRDRPAPTELECGTRDDPIVLDPPGKFQCIVEAAIF